jgi:protein-disulfide isomerase
VENEPRLIENYIKPGKVRLIYRHLLQLGDGSLRAAQANECAGDQGKFWEMRALLYQNQADMYANIDSTLATLSGTLKLDKTAFQQCMQAETHRAAIEADFDSATKAGVRSRPVFDINGKLLIGYQPYEIFSKQVDAALK